MSSKSSKKKPSKPAKKSVFKPAGAATKPAAPATKAAAPASKPAVAKAATKTKGRGVRYSPTLKQEVVDFVSEYNAKNGRGGQSAAARKFGVTILTVSSWLKGSGKPSAKAIKPGKAVKGTAVPAGLAAKVKALLDLGEQIRRLQAQHAALSAAIRSEI